MKVSSGLVEPQLEDDVQYVKPVNKLMKIKQDYKYTLVAVTGVVTSS